MFEDPPHFTNSNGAETLEDNAATTGFTDDQLYQILDFPGLIKVLAEVAIDHPIHSLPGPLSRPANKAQPDGLQREIQKFFQSEQYTCLTVTIQFNDWNKKKESALFTQVLEGNSALR